MFTCEVSGSSEYETNFFFSYCTAHYVISIHFRPLTMHLDFSNEIASGYEKKIQICVAFSWQDDLIKLFLSAHIFPQCNAKEFNGQSVPTLIKSHSLSFDPQH